MHFRTAKGRSEFAQEYYREFLGYLRITWGRPGVTLEMPDGFGGELLFVRNRLQVLHKCCISSAYDRTYTYCRQTLLWIIATWGTFLKRYTEEQVAGYISDHFVTTWTSLPYASPNTHFQRFVRFSRIRALTWQHRCPKLGGAFPCWLSGKDEAAALGVLESTASCLSPPHTLLHYFSRHQVSFR